MGILYIVATPIGNLEDITLRALRVLKSVDLIACEDTRHSKILLDHYEIKLSREKLISFHQHSRLERINYLASCLQEGKNIALITDAGTPGIADPAGILIVEALKAKIKVIPIPGVSAVTTILSVAGFQTDKFLFLGFLPKKKGRQKNLQNLKNIEVPIVFLESCHRIVKTLEDLKYILGDREIIVGRELTKKFEEIYRGEITKVIPKIKAQGEFVILIKGK